MKIEELDFFYQCLQSLGALDRGLVQSLISLRDWRCVVWASWLVLLEPRTEFLAPLRDAAAEINRDNSWLVVHAIGAIEGGAPAPEHARFVQLTTRMRALLASIPRPSTPLRAAPTEAQVARMQRERTAIRAVYRRDGATAARAAATGTLAHYYSMRYRTWVRAGAPPPPTESEFTPAA